MCGFAGTIALDVSALDKLNVDDVLNRMSARIYHRGPDDGGIWIDREAGYAVCHRRLAIQDLSTAGHQPMRSHCGRYVITYNGEIYNHLSLRDEIEAESRSIAWRGHSDTETLLAAIVLWGLEQTLARVSGMFAFAVWDRIKKTLVLARDRMGEKPLYYGFQGNVFLFGSELKALRVHPSWQGRVDRKALSLYLHYNNVPAPLSIYEGIYKLSPGAYLELDTQAHAFRRRELPSPVRYWSLEKVAMQGQRRLFCGDTEEAKESLGALIARATCDQLISDAPLGAFLSGGVDSSMVVAMMQAHASSSVNTYAIGFEASDYDEAPYAREVASYLGTKHETLYLSSTDTLEVVPQLSEVWDEPFGDASQIPTLVLARFARQHVTVALSGDGGDELFGGYNRHVAGERLWRLIRRVPGPARKVLLELFSWAPVKILESMLKIVGNRTPQLEEKLEKVRRLLRCDNPDLLYHYLVSVWLAPEELVLESIPASSFVTMPSAWPGLSSYTEKMIFLDATTYLPDDVLTKVDRASMAASLETRAPMLDHRLVEFAWSLPLSMRIKEGTGKWLLRQVLYDHIPASLIERPKQGFSAPIGQWLRGPLKEWAEALLAEERLRREGYFRVEIIRRTWRQFLSGRPCHQQLWNILMFQAWLEQQ